MVGSANLGCLFELKYFLKMFWIWFWFYNLTHVQVWTFRKYVVINIWPIGKLLYY